MPTILIPILLASAGMLHIHVAPGGSDQAPGTAEAPFATPARARDALRAARRSDDPPSEVVVSFADGFYSLSEPLILNEADAGSEDSPVIWRAGHQGGAHFFGGIALSGDSFVRPVDEVAIERIPVEARTKVISCDLKAAGMTDFGVFPDNFEGAPPIPELFFNNLRMNLARWPNDGWSEIAKVIDSGPAPWRNHTSEGNGTFTINGGHAVRWAKAPAVWIEGYWCFDWAAATIRVKSIDPERSEITLASPHVYGIGSGNPAQRRFRVINLLEELDEPGEYFIDREAGVLYFIPPGPLEGSRVVVSRLADPMIQVTKGRFITFQGLVFEDCAGVGVRVTEGEGVAFEGCTVRNTGLSGVIISGGSMHRVRSCDVYDTGTGGVEVGGGDRRTLSPCGHRIENNHIRDVSRRMRTHAYNLHVSGVGVRIAHNLVVDAPHQAIGLGGNDHVIEFNEIARVGMASDDCGALYMGRNPSERGTVIRWNYWHDIGGRMAHGSCAVYFDDGAGGQLVYGNVFRKAAGGDFGAVFNHGGHDNMVVNNIFIDCTRAVGAAPWSAALWRKWLDEPLWQRALLQDVDITRPPYSARYPGLVGLMESDKAPRLNKAERNIAVRCRSFSAGNWEIRDCVTLAEDPGFVDEPGGDFTLRPDAQVLGILSGFEPIPFDKIGLEADEFRTLPRIGK